MVGRIFRSDYIQSVRKYVIDKTKAYIEEIDDYDFWNEHINYVEYYANETEDDIQAGIVGGLIEEVKDPNGEGTMQILGETFIKVKKTYEFKYDGNQGGLEKAGESTYVESNNSGLANISTSGIAGKGKLLAGALEMSNVDLTEQFTDMIITQSGFQANSKTIQTANTLLETVLTLKR